MNREKNNAVDGSKRPSLEAEDQRRRAENGVVLAVVVDSRGIGYTLPICLGHDVIHIEKTEPSE